jgi:Uncharacterised nucleotidyltransferase
MSLERGQRIATLLEGAWRAAPPPLALPAAQLASIVPKLVGTGTGGLAWWKTRGLDPQCVPALDTLAACHRLHCLEAFMLEVRLHEVVQTLRHNDGIEPLLAKGWAVARLYPAPGLRPYGDFDLHIEKQRLSGRLYTEDYQPMASWLDLHQDLPEMPDRSFTEAFRRAELVPLRSTVIRVLGPEDHLRLLCLHFVRHGGWRPLWLCDIAALAESLPPGFDGDYFWSGEPRYGLWVRAVLGLAQRLLGARLPDKLAGGTDEGCAWLQTAVLQTWGSRAIGDSLTRDQRPFRSHLLRPWGLWRAVRCRLPNAIEASFHLEQRADELPRLAWLRWRFLLDRGKRYLARSIAPPLRPSLHQ